MTGSESTVERVVDAVLEAPVFTSFTRLGYDTRSRLANWKPLGDYDATGRVILVTGATSGLGLVTAEQLAAAGATVVLLGRDAAKTNRVRDEIATRTGSELISTVVADMGDLVAVRRVAEELNGTLDRLDVLIHNAGALSATRQVSPQGTELTVASQVVGPFLLTFLLLPLLVRSAPARVLTMSSGGMYASPLRVEELQMGDDYKGSEQYARAKRAQVTLNEMWAHQHPARDVVFHAMHPGWADTPGVRDSLPTFRKIVGPLLRSPLQGADTMVWLALDDGAPLATTGMFWLDRHERSIHKLPTTRSSDTPQRREQLWEWVSTAAG
ncbi:MAG TPA: SDR family NAD(P)-dependent oxidoreductase [Ilumatobacteraceae bacterium]|nr:SDR family NAD(P)-dependent oxidoreductase [Ilumatobacteraceae bacterium]HRB02632.1 SDR family NAD(P)-dependent oxidoreductase [Ilumatobacteraceae bacterium]